MRAQEAQKVLLDRSIPIKRTEELAVMKSIDRVLSDEIISSVDLPCFNRAAMDGFAIKSEDTRGASSSAPICLQEFMPIRTGMVVPEGFDAVVMLEDALLHDNIIEVSSEAYPYRNVSRIGEDIRRGDIVLKKDHRLRPPDIALLAALGQKSVRVYARPLIVIIPTGSELVPIGNGDLKPGEAYEINGLMAQLYVERWGGLSLKREIVPDNHYLIREAIRSNLNADMILIIGGTSIGEKDYAPKVLDELGDMLGHGVRIQPGKPTAFGEIEGKLVICLPGYPVAALSVLYLFVRPILKKLAHRKDDEPKVCVRLARKIASRIGYLNLVRVTLVDDEAEPIMISGAGILSSVTRSDGFVVVPEEREGLEAGEMVEVHLFE